MSVSTMARSRVTHPAFIALGIIIVVIATEYIARHFALFWLPQLGSRRVNDMLVSGIAYSALVWFTLGNHQRNVAAIRAALGAIVGNWRTVGVYIAVFCAFFAGSLALIDRQLWGQLELPSVSSPWSWPLTLFSEQQFVLIAISMLLVNGIIIPLAEEWLWRNLIQPRMIGTLGTVGGILATSLAFSLKHAIVDASFGRLLALVVFGIAMGILAYRRSWRASALAHSIVNTIATILALATFGEHV